MFRMTKISAAALMIAGAAAPFATYAQEPQKLERVEITGSAIKRIDAETAVPVTVVKMEDLKAQGVTSVEQIMASLSAVQMTQGSSQQVGSGTGGAAFADLRGIGSNKTLVLLNGRRIANNAIDGSAPDLNMIPFAALERVEVLRDGASALYGTDAIGGVINFITRRDYRGGSLTLSSDRPQMKGGESDAVNLAYGMGDLNADGFNVFGVFDIARARPIDGQQRDINQRFPGGLSPTPFPANYYQDGAVTANPSAPGCTAPTLIPAGDGTSCYMSTSRFVDYTTKNDRMSLMLRGSLKVAGEHTLSAEFFSTSNDSVARIAPVPYGQLWMNRLRPDGSLNPYFPGNPGAITPGFTINPTFTATNMAPRPGVVLQPGFIYVKWRALAGGQRTNESQNDQQRLLVSMNGALGSWDYQTGFSVNQNKVKELVTGYSDGNKIAAAMANGVINPFGAQDAAGAKAINDALLGGNLQNHRGRVTALDGRMSRELGNWFGAGNAAVAVGAEIRHEDFLSEANAPVAEKLVASTGVDPNSRSAGKRDVYAIYSEMSVPVNSKLEATLAARYDKYSDFGSSVNPKVGLRYQPSKNLLVRGSYSTGFRAPSLYELNASQSYTNTGTTSDPVNCPDGKNPIPGKSKSLNCNVQFQRLNGGNLDLKPEKAQNLTMGVVFEPTNTSSISLDFWWIRQTDTIGALSYNTILGDAKTFAQYIKRNATGDLSIDGFSCPGSTCGYLDTRNQNLGGRNARGVDLSATTRIKLEDMGFLTLSFNTSYMAKYEYQNYKNGPWVQNVGVYVGSGPIFRAQHSATARWALGKWTLGATGHYKSGYVDQDPSNTVSNYATLDLFSTWQATKKITLTAGVNNATNREPPYSNQDEVFQANYDPRFTDVVGRKYYMRATLKF